MLQNTPYHFVSTFDISVPTDRIWNELVAVKQWPAWWPMLRQLSVIRPAESFKLTIGTFFYALTFIMTNTEIDRDKGTIKFTATGDLVGTGNFVLTTLPGGTRIVFVWDVVTTRSWMNLIAPIAKPLFIQSHHVVMHTFGTGLARQTGGTLQYEHHQ